MDVVVPRDGFELAGDLLLPSVEPLCGVVMIGGSGAADRVNGGYFEPIRTHLVGRGVAVLSYDKRGVGDSGGTWVHATLEDFADDALAATAALHAVLPPSVPTIVYGHSEGGWVALIAAAREPSRVDRIITTSCPGVTPGAQDRHAVAVEVADSRDGDEVLAAYDQVMAASHYASALGTLKAVPRLRNLLGELSEQEWAFLTRKQDYDPIRDADNITCPWLAVYGAADRLVPVAQSVAAFANRATTVTIPGADHRLQIEGRLAASFLDTVTEWLLSEGKQFR